MSEEATEQVSNKKLQEGLGENYYLTDDEPQQNPIYLINRAERIIDEQERKIEALREQVIRYEQIKLGVIVLIGLFGLSNIGNAIEFGLSDLVPLLLYFILISIAMVSSSVLSRNLSPILRHLSPTITDLATPHDDSLQQLEGMSQVVIEGEGKKASELIDEISENNKDIDRLNHRLRYSYLTILLAAIILPILKFPELLTSFLELYLSILPQLT